MKRLLLVAFLVSGCATPQQQAAYRAQQVQAYTDRLTQICQAYGFKPEAMADCRMQLDIIANQRPTFTQSVGRGLRAGGEVMRSEPSTTTRCVAQPYPGVGTQITCR